MKIRKLSWVFRAWWASCAIVGISAYVVKENGGIATAAPLIIAWLVLLVGLLGPVVWYEKRHKTGKAKIGE